MNTICKTLIVLLLTVAAAGCTGLIAPGSAQTGAPVSAPMAPLWGLPAAAPEVAPEETEPQDSVLAEDVPAGEPPSPAPDAKAAPSPVVPVRSSPLPIYAAADPHAGGVSALPADVDGGDAPRTPWDFTLTLTADPFCEAPSDSDEEIDRYDVKGIVGGVLRDGTRVPVTSGCELLTVRFNLAVSKNAVHCQDIHVAEDCRFEGTITAPRYQQPTVYVIRGSGKFQDCSDLSGIDARPDWQELDFMARPPSEKLPACSAMQIKESLGPQLKQTLAHPDLSN